MTTQGLITDPRDANDTFATALRELKEMIESGDNSASYGEANRDEMFKIHGIADTPETRRALYDQEIEAGFRNIDGTWK